MPYLDPEKKREANRRWIRENPEKVVAAELRRREKVKKIITAEILEERRAATAKRMRAWREENQERLREYDREYRRQHPEQYARGKRSRKYRAKYNITLAEKEQMWADQGGACRICRRVMIEKRNTCVDHCHATGRVRALLCNNCNSAVGFLDENEDAAEALLRYLQVHNLIRDLVG